MREKVYIMRFEDGAKSGARSMLFDMGACVLEAVSLGTRGIPASYARNDCVAVILGDERQCPSKHLRQLPSVTVAKEKGFSVPPVIEELAEEHEQKFGRVLPITVIRPRSYNKAELATALKNAHWRDSTGKWCGEVSPGRKLRKARQRAQRRERVTGDYTDPYLYSC